MRNTSPDAARRPNMLEQNQAAMRGTAGIMTPLVGELTRERLRHLVAAMVD